MYVLIDSVVLETVVNFLADLLKRGAKTSCLANADAVVAREVETGERWLGEGDVCSCCSSLPSPQELELVVNPDLWASWFMETVDGGLG